MNVDAFVTEDILDSSAIVYFEAGVAEWLSRWPRDPRSIIVGKLASGPRARRGSNPFPGATNIVLDESPASVLFGFFEDFCCVVVADVLEASFE